MTGSRLYSWLPGGLSTVIPEAPQPARSGFEDDRDAAIDGLVDWLTENPWPDVPGFRLRPIAWSAITEARKARYKDVSGPRAAAYWRGHVNVDGFTESLTDRIGVVQALDILTLDQRRAVTALAEAYKTSDGRDAINIAAGIYGGSRDSYLQSIEKARRAVRAVWVAPGETPPRKKYAWGDRYNKWLDRQRYARKKAGPS